MTIDCDVVRLYVDETREAVGITGDIDGLNEVSEDFMDIMASP